MRPLNKTLIYPLIGTLLAGPLCAAVIFGPDAAMSTADWSLGVNSLTNATSYQATLTDITTGNPDDALNLNLQFNRNTSSATTVIQFVKRDDWTYNPSVSGAVTEINFSGDFSRQSPFNVTISAGILQGGISYWTQISDNALINSDGWNAASLTGLVESDFLNHATNIGSPDFSASGGEMTFGYFVRRGQGVGGGGSMDFDIGADNVSLTVIPEPSTITLVLGALFAAGLLGRRRLRG